MKTSAAIMVFLFIGACSGSPKQTEPVADDGWEVYSPGHDAGTVTGTVSFIGKDCPEGTEAEGCSGPMVGYLVEILNDKGAVVTSDVTDETGVYSIKVADGDFIIKTQSGVNKTDVKTSKFSISSLETVTVDLTVDTGIR